MTQAHSRARQAKDEEPVGSLAQEAAKLFEALQGMSGNHDGDVGGVADAASGLWQGLSRHLEDDGNCRYCPLCQLIGVLRQPEVRGHLASAGRSLVSALASALDTRVPDDGRPGPRESPTDRRDGAL